MNSYLKEIITRNKVLKFVHFDDSVEINSIYAAYYFKHTKPFKFKKA